MPLEMTGGLFVAGLLLGCLGPLLITFQYHINSLSQHIGAHFAGLAVGLLMATLIARGRPSIQSMRRLCSAACVVAAASLITLFLSAPPANVWWRVGALCFLAASSGILLISLCRAPRLEYKSVLVIRSSYLAGWVCAAILVATTYFAGLLHFEILFLALAPCLYLLVLARKRDAGYLEPQTPPLESKENTIVLQLLLSLQSASEWMIGGWLALFLIHRFGCNPASAVLTLALYLAVLALGCFPMAALRQKISSTALWSIAVSLTAIGYISLHLAPSLPWAAAAVTVLALGLASASAVRFTDTVQRWPLLLALMAGGGVSWLPSIIEVYLGMQYIMILPAVSSLLVAVLGYLVIIETSWQQGPPVEPSAKVRSAGSTG